MLETKKIILSKSLQSGDVKLEHYKEHIFTLLPHFTEEEIYKMLAIRPPYDRYYNEFKEKPYSLFLIAKNTKLDKPFGFMYILIEDDEKRIIQVHGGRFRFSSCNVFKIYYNFIKNLNNRNILINRR